MADQENKQEAATPFKLEEARRKGQVGRSIEFVGLFALLAMLLAFAVMSETILGGFAKHTTWMLSSSAQMAHEPGMLAHRFALFVQEIAYALMPVWVAGILAAIAASIVHMGPVFSTFPLKPDFNRINPAQGLKKIFSRKGLIELAKLLVKLSLFVGVIYLVWQNSAEAIYTVGTASFPTQLGLWQTLTWSLIKALLVVFVVSAIFDLWYSKRDFARQMKMSRRDIKDENKRREGDPEIKAKRRRNQSDLMKKVTSIKSVADADVIVTNPTHVAIALRYRAKTMGLPVVLSMGKGVLASQIMRAARRHRVPIIRRPPLARALYRSSMINQPIPMDQQQGVAEVYRWVLSIPGNKVMGT